MPARIKSLIPLHKRDAKPGRETWGDPFYARREWRATESLRVCLANGIQVTMEDFPGWSRTDTDKRDAK